MDSKDTGLNSIYGLSRLRDENFTLRASISSLKREMDHQKKPQRKNHLKLQEPAAHRKLNNS
jgi:hypothetical protein